MQKDKQLIGYDITFLIVSLYLSLLLRFDFNIPQEYMVFLKLSIIPVVIITLVFNKFFNLYSSIWKYASVEELISIVYSVSLSNVFFIIYSYFVNYKFLENRYYRFPFSVHIIFWMLSVIALGGTRFTCRVCRSK